MPPPSPRLAVRAVIVEADRLLIVNAFPDPAVPLMCLPGGGVERGSSLPDNLAREVFEETGLQIAVGAPCLINEFHDPDGAFHQVEVLFRASVLPNSARPTDWQDLDDVVVHRRWVTQAELARIPHKPSCLAQLAFGDHTALSYDPLEPIWQP